MRCLHAMYAKDTVCINQSSKGVNCNFKCQQGVKQGCPLNLFRLYLDALKGRLDSRKCDALALVNMHVWLLFFANDLVLTSKLEVGLQQQLNALEYFYVDRGLIMNVKTKVMVFNCVDPCQEFVFKCDVIECVQTFKYLRILPKTSPNLDNVLEHLAITSKHLLFALNYYCAKLCIMDIKLHYDLVDMLVRSITRYACEVWGDSKKIEAIEIVY